MSACACVGVLVCVCACGRDGICRLYVCSSALICFGYETDDLLLIRRSELRYETGFWTWFSHYVV